MEEKKQIKMSFKLVMIIVIIIILLISIVGISVYKIIRNNIETQEMLEFDIKDSKKETISDEVNEYCIIKGDNSNLLYKNEYVSDTTYLEKVIFLDESAKKNMLEGFDVLDVNELLQIGAFDGEFIRVKYDSDLFEYEMALAYIEDGGFYDCTTNNQIKKAFNENNDEVDFPKISFDYNDEIEIPSNISTIYTLYDITTNEGEEYIVGMYDKVFSKDNPNALLITVVLKKQNARIDINNEKQVENFWKKYADYEIEEISENIEMDYEKTDINGETYYLRVTDNTWKGEYHQDKYETSVSNNKEEVVSYNDYINCINEINSNADEKIKKYYEDEKSNYIILSYANGYGFCDLELIDCVKENDKIIIYGDENVRGVLSGTGYFIAIPTDMPIGTEIEYRECYSKLEISNLNNYGTLETEIKVDKPIIYLYPTVETEVSVKLLKDENLTCSYPKYQNGWSVLAQTNGNLKDLTTNRDLYSLYYESKSTKDFKIENDGFVVKGEDTIEFLEEKLDILGLTEREAEEFIVYWLPKLESNKYNYIRFASLDEINENMPLEINPNPDTIIRILMTFKGLDSPIDINEQKLTTPDRKGFVAVEWGGTEIK